MAAVLALLSALVWGASDFCGGLASRRASAYAVVAGSQAIGLVALLAVAPATGGSATAADLGWGAAAGVCGAAGLVLLYRAMATGVMSVVAPVTSLCAAAVPVLAGLVLGERIGPAAAVGIALALVAVVLVASEGGLRALRSVRPDVLGLPLLSGVGFGLFFVLLHRTGPGAGLWPLVAARLVATLFVGAVLLARREPVRYPRPALLPLALAGLGDMGGNALFLLASHHGELAVTAVLASLYPASTVLLAQLVLRERLARSQAAGLATAAAAVVLITLPA
jgi:drug/metabolite transporter (DMT)-like permease